LEKGRYHGGKVLREWFGPFRPGVMFHHPDTLKLILRTAEPKSTEGNGPYNFVRGWLGEDQTSILKIKYV